MKKFLIYISACFFALNLFAYDLDTNYWNQSDNIWTSKNPISIQGLENFNYYLSKNKRDLIFNNERANTIYRFNPENFSFYSYKAVADTPNTYNHYTLSPDEESIFYTYIQSNPWILFLVQYDYKNNTIIKKTPIDTCNFNPQTSSMYVNSLKVLDSFIINLSYTISTLEATYPPNNTYTYNYNYNLLIDINTNNILETDVDFYQNGYIDKYYLYSYQKTSPPNNVGYGNNFEHYIAKINNTKKCIFSKYSYSFNSKDQLNSNNYSKFNTLHIGFDGTTEKYNLLEIDSTYYPITYTPKQITLNRIREVDLKTFETNFYNVNQEQINRLNYISGSVPNTKVYYKQEDFGFQLIAIPSCDTLGKIYIDTSVIKTSRWLNENWIHYINKDGHSVMINLDLNKLCRNNIIHASKRIATVDENIFFRINKIYPNLDYEWIFSDSETKTDEYFDKSFANEGLYSIKLLVKQNNIVIDSVYLKDFIKIINKNNKIVISEEQTNDDYLTRFDFVCSFVPDSVHWYCYSKSDTKLMWNSTDSSITKSKYWDDDQIIYLYLFVGNESILLQADCSNKSKIDSLVEVKSSKFAPKLSQYSYIDLKLMNGNLFTNTFIPFYAGLQNTIITAYDKDANLIRGITYQEYPSSQYQLPYNDHYQPFITDSNNNFFTNNLYDIFLFDSKSINFTNKLLKNFEGNNQIIFLDDKSLLAGNFYQIYKLSYSGDQIWQLKFPFNFKSLESSFLNAKKYNNNYYIFGRTQKDSLALFIIAQDAQILYSKVFTKYKHPFYQPAEIFGNKLYIPLSQDSITTESILIFNMDDYSYEIKSVNKNKMFIKKIKHIRFNKGEYFALTGISANRNTIRIIDTNLNFVKDFYLPPIVPLNAAIEIPENLFQSTNYFYGYNKSDWSIGTFVINSSDSIDIPVDTNKIPIDTNKVSIQKLNKQIYPNPCIDKFSLYLKLDSETTVSLNIYNHMGLLYDSIENIQCSKGENSINYNFSKEMAPGIYYIEIIANNDRYFEKFIIQR